MSAENFSFQAEDAESDDSDASEDEQEPRRGIAVGKLFVTNRDGMGAESRAKDRSDHEPRRPIGSFLVGRPDAGVESAVIDTSREAERAAAPVAAETSQTTAETVAAEEGGEAPQDAVSPAEAAEQPAEQIATGLELQHDAAPAEIPQMGTLPLERIPESTGQAPQTAEEALVVWARQEQEKEPPQGWLYEGELLVQTTAAEQPEQQPAEATEPIPVPTTAELEERTGLAPPPALQPRIIRPVGTVGRPRPRARQIQAQTQAQTPSAPAPVAAGNTPPISPNTQPLGYNSPITPNIPPNPTAPPTAGGNMDTPPPPPGVPPFGGPPHGPSSPGINPNNSGGWNPAQSWRQTAPNFAPGAASEIDPTKVVAAANQSNGAALALFGYLLGRRHGRKKAERRLNPKIRATNNQLKQTAADLNTLRTEQQQQRAAAAQEQTRMSGELATFARRVGNTEQQNEELKAQNERLGQEMEAAKRRDAEKAKADEKAEKTMKSQAVRRFRNARTRFERFSKAAEQSEAARTDIDQLIAQEGNRLVRSGWVTNEVDSQGRVVGEAESVIKHGQAFHQERAVERGVAAKSQPAGEVALLATVAAAGGKRPEAAVRGGDGSSVPYLPGATPGQAQYPGLPGNQPQPGASYTGKAPYQPPVKQKQSTSPVWPYVLALVVIFICLVVLLH